MLSNTVWLNRQSGAVQAVFTAVCNLAGVERFISFGPVEAETGLPRNLVRRACRHLARRGLLIYDKGLWSDAGAPAGAGYGLTERGHALWLERNDDGEALENEP